MRRQISPPPESHIYISDQHLRVKSGGNNYGWVFTLLWQYGYMNECIATVLFCIVKIPYKTWHVPTPAGALVKSFNFHCG